MAAMDPNKFKSSVDGPLTGEPSNDAAELVEKGQRAVKNLSHKLSQGQEDIARAATQLTDSIAKGKDELRAAVADIGEKIPTTHQVRTAVANAPVDMRLVTKPWLFGLFLPAPCWPPEKLTVRVVVKRAKPIVIFLVIVGVVAAALCFALLFSLPLLAVLMPPALLLWHQSDARKRRQQEALAAFDAAAAPPLDWREGHAEYFSTSTPEGQDRRDAAAQAVLASVQPQHAATLNAHVAGVTGLAVYGCGILAAAHVGGLKALERHGLDYSKIETLAGVSAGSVVVAMLAVGARADELFELVQSLPFHQLGQPELGSLLRASFTTMHTIASTLFTPNGAKDLSRLVNRLGVSNGPGLNSGAVLEKLIADALRGKTGNEHITLGQVKRTYGKRLVIIVTELDSGRERRLTPEDDPDLPVRVAVRMSMGVPGIMEPLRYENHVYCDGGMTNDFPMNALPEGPGKRLGLMVRPKEWVAYNMGWSLEDVAGKAQLDAAPSLRADFERADRQLRSQGCYPVRDPFDLMMTSVQTMMDANLALQIKGAQRDAPASPSQPPGLFALAPQILTLSGGSLSPFDFGLGKRQHRDLFHAGQLCAHLTAAQLEMATTTTGGGGGGDARAASRRVMSDESKLKVVLHCLHLDYPKSS